MKVQKEENRFFINESDKLVGEITFVKKSNYLIANHTFVNPDYRGQGIAEILLEVLVDYALKNGFKIQAVCSYVRKKFTESDRYNNVKL